MQYPIDSNTVAYLSGLAFSVGMMVADKYFPGQQLTGPQKRYLIAALSVITAIVLVAAKCQGDTACYGENWQAALSAALFTFGGTQSAWVFLKEALK